MKKITIIQTGIIILLLTASITGCATEEKPPMQKEQTETDIAILLMNHFINNTITTSYNTLFTDGLKEQTNVEQLEFIRTQIITHYGEIIEITSTRSTEEQVIIDIANWMTALSGGGA